MRNASSVVSGEAFLTHNERFLVMADATVSRSSDRRNAFVYILRSETGLLKIGVSLDPESRLKSLLTGHPFGLEIVYLLECDERLSHPIERATHIFLKRERVNGEWFDVPLCDAISALASVLNIFLIADKAPIPREQWSWKCALDKSEEKREDIVNSECEQAVVISRSKFLEISMLAVGVMLTATCAAAYYAGVSLFPPHVVDDNAKNYGEWMRTVAYYNECGLYLIGPSLLFVSIRELMPNRSKLAMRS
jgi:hypothetical protein